MIRKTEKIKILFVDTDKNAINTFISFFGNLYNILPATSSKEALQLFQQQNDIGVVITEQDTPGITGIELLEQVQAKNPDSVGIIITTSMDISDILDAVNKGRIFHYMLKPWDENQLRLVLDQVATRWQKRQDCKLIREKLINNNKILTAENAKLKASAGHLHHLAAHLLTVHEQERNRISIKLQNELGEALAGFKQDIKAINQLLFLGKESEMENQLETLRLSAGKLSGEVKRLSASLNLGIIDELGLDAALEKLVDTFSLHYRITCSFNPLELDGLFSPYRQRVIYRLFQESLNNIIKHAEASHIKIDMQNLDGDVIIRISDDGKGFAVKKVMLRSADIRGIGLSAMAERARMLAGEMEIISKPGEGTSLVFAIPADGSEDNHLQDWIDGSLRFY